MKFALISNLHRLLDQWEEKCECWVSCNETVVTYFNVSNIWLWKTTKNIIKIVGSRGGESNTGPLEYEKLC